MDKRAVIIEAGMALARDPELLGKVKAAKAVVFSRRRSMNELHELLVELGKVATMAKYPNKYREANSLIDDLNLIINVADRYIARSTLAKAAGETEFNVGMLVIVHDKGQHWISGRVTKLHEDGRFTAKLIDSSVVCDPRVSVTVTVINY